VYLKVAPIKDPEILCLNVYNTSVLMSKSLCTVLHPDNSAAVRNSFTSHTVQPV
jgi:hypothetical protein